MTSLRQWLHRHNLSALSPPSSTSSIREKEIKQPNYLHAAAEEHLSPRITIQSLLQQEQMNTNINTDQLLQDIAKDVSGDPRYFRHCGTGAARRGLDHKEWKQSFVNNSISLVVVNLNSPFSFLNSVLSWEHTGLMDIVDEKIAILSNSTASEIAIAIRYGFKVMRPADIDTYFKLSQDVFTISAAFYYGLQYARHDNVLFLESDFAADLSLTPHQMTLQLVGAVGMLDRGAHLVRLQSRKGMGTFSFQNCNTQKFDDTDRKRNWYTFYCNSTLSGQRKIQQSGNTCLETPRYKCFTSRDSNWSLNSCLVRKSAMLNTQYKFTLPEPKKKKKKRKSVDLSRYSHDNKTVVISIPDIGLHFCSFKQVGICIVMHVCMFLCRILFFNCSLLCIGHL
jgi:hypothetical protein